MDAEQLQVIVAGGLVALSFGVLIWRTILNDKQVHRLLDLHWELLDHLSAAANPEAWLARQADKARERRREQESAEPKKSDEDWIGVS